MPIFLLFLALGAGAAAFGIYERGHGQDPHGLSVSETMKLHWKAMWHHQQAAEASDPNTAAAHLAAARDATLSAAPSVSKAATTAPDDLSRARAVALSDLMAANGHLTAAMAGLVQAKETRDRYSTTETPPNWRKEAEDQLAGAQREVDAAIARVKATSARLGQLGVAVPGVAHA
jgi:hypothetical protein